MLLLILLLSFVVTSKYECLEKYNLLTSRELRNFISSEELAVSLESRLYIVIMFWIYSLNTVKVFCLQI